MAPKVPLPLSKVNLPSEPLMYPSNSLQDLIPLFYLLPCTFKISFAFSPQPTNLLLLLHPKLSKQSYHPLFKILPLIFISEFTEEGQHFTCYSLMDPYSRIRDPSCAPTENALATISGNSLPSSKLPFNLPSLTTSSDGIGCLLLFWGFSCYLHYSSF